MHLNAVVVAEDDVVSKGDLVGYTGASASGFGNYSDSSTQDLTATAAWGSTNPATATSSATGLASGILAGASNISATHDSVTSNTAVLTVTVPPPTLQSITVAPAAPSIEEGQTQQFTATGNYSDSSTQDLTATAAWSSTNPATATISATGLASGILAGASNISATHDSVTSNTAVLTVTVPPPTLQSITVAPAAPSIEEGQTQQFTATGNYSDSSTQDLTATAAWSSTNPATATISATGLASGILAGASNISATHDSVTSNTAVLTVTVPPPTLQSITVAPAAPSIEEGQQQQFTATGNYSDSSTQDLTATAAWSSTNPATATISATGLASGILAGASNISATHDSVTSNTAVLTVTVPPPTLQSITVAPAAPSIEEGQTQQFTATGNYSDSSTQDLTATAAWSSTNPATATISATGLASGILAGASNISATHDSVTSNTAVLTVTVPPTTLQSITVAPAAPSIEEGQTQQFTATGNYSDSSTQDLTATAAWSSTNPATATISATGLASGILAGASNISATHDSVTSNTAVLTVTVPPPTLQSITVAPAAPSIEEGQTQQFTATGNYSDSSTQDLTATAAWSSTNPATATISATGLASGILAGASNISATHDSVTSNTAVLTVTVTLPPNPTQEIILQVSEGYDEKNDKTLSEDGKLNYVQANDTDRIETISDYFTSFEFDSFSFPATAVIQSVKISVVHYEESSFGAGSLEWDAAQGPLTGPTTLLVVNPALRIDESAEGLDIFDASSAIDTPAKVNDLKLVVRNNDSANDKKTFTDHIFVTVEFTE